MIYLFFLSGAKKGKIESADAQVVRIGRQPYCEIPLDAHHDIPASGDHCHIIRETDGSYYVLDSGSTFGTFLNGNQIQGRVKLTTGDVIECGKDPAGGREGPRLKFYLETDIRKCPICSAPVYKRHFRCPDCRKKTCLRCIDFTHKVCKHCADARQAAALAAAEAAKKAAAAGFEVIEDDDVAAKRPAKVILKGKEAERLRKKKKAGEASSDLGATRGAGAKSPEPSSLEAATTFCEICHDFVKGKYFTCPACQRPLCVSHQTGKVCAPCAGMPAAAIKATRVMPEAAGAADEGVVAELVANPPASAPRPISRPTPRTTVAPAHTAAPATPPAARRPPTPAADPSSSGRRGPAAVPVTPATPPYARATPDDSTLDAPPHEVPPPAGTFGVPSRATGTATCSRCRARLGPGTFACRSCHRVLCAAHVAVDDCCEECYLAGLDRRLPPRGPHGAASRPTPPGAPGALSPLPPVPGAPLGATRAFDQGRFQRSLEDTSAPTGPRPPGFHTLELPRAELESQRRDAGLLPHVFDPTRPPTLSEIEAMDMMPLLDTEQDSDVEPTVHTAETKKDFPIPVLDPTDDLAPRPTSGVTEGGLTGLSFVCPHCDAPLAPNARACSRCRRAL